MDQDPSKTREPLPPLPEDIRCLFVSTIQTYFLNQLKQTLSEEDASRLVEPVRHKMAALTHKSPRNPQYIREALAHVLQTRIWFELPLVFAEKELVDGGYVAPPKPATS